MNGPLLAHGATGEGTTVACWDRIKATDKKDVEDAACTQFNNFIMHARSRCRKIKDT